MNNENTIHLIAQQPWDVTKDGMIRKTRATGGIMMGGFREVDSFDELHNFKIGEAVQLTKTPKPNEGAPMRPDGTPAKLGDLLVVSKESPSEEWINVGPFK